MGILIQIIFLCFFLVSLAFCKNWYEPTFINDTGYLDNGDEVDKASDRLERSIEDGFHIDLNNIVSSSSSESSSSTSEQSSFTQNENGKTNVVKHVNSARTKSQSVNNNGKRMYHSTTRNNKFDYAANKNNRGYGETRFLVHHSQNDINNNNGHRRVDYKSFGTQFHEKNGLNQHGKHVSRWNSGAHATHIKTNRNRLVKNEGFAGTGSGRFEGSDVSASRRIAQNLLQLKRPTAKKYVASHAVRKMTHVVNTNKNHRYPNIYHVTQKRPFITHRIPPKNHVSYRYPGTAHLSPAHFNYYKHLRGYWPTYQRRWHNGNNVYPTRMQQYIIRSYRHPSLMVGHVNTREKTRNVGMHGEHRTPQYYQRLANRLTASARLYPQVRTYYDKFGRTTEPRYVYHA